MNEFVAKFITHQTKIIQRPFSQFLDLKIISFFVLFCLAAETITASIVKDCKYTREATVQLSFLVLMSELC